MSGRLTLGELSFGSKLGIGTIAEQVVPGHWMLATVLTTAGGAALSQLPPTLLEVLLDAIVFDRLTVAPLL